MERIPFGVTLQSVKGGTGTYDGELPGAYPVKWAKRDGDAAVKDEEIASVETDKVVLSVTAPVSGRVASIFPESEWSANGEMIESPFGSIIAPALGEIETDSVDSLEKVVESWENEGGNGATRTTPLAKKMADRQGLDVRNIKGTGPGGRVCAADVESAKSIRAVPIARARAREHGINIETVRGSGENGLILLEDVQRTVEALGHLEKTAETAERAQPSEERAGKQRTPHIRKTISRLLSKSWREIPHGRDEITADVTILVAFLKMYKTYGEQFSGIRLRLDCIIAWYAIRLLKEEKFRILNAYWDKETEETVFLPEINIGTAVNTERGLMIPVVRNAGAHGTFSIFSGEMEAQVAKVKKSTARLSDMRDLTFTVNNTGALGGENPFSILPYAICSDGSERPTSMMVNLPRIRKEEGRSFLSLVMFFDHRPFDGDVPMAFITELRRRIEEKKAPEDFQKELFGSRAPLE